jgi:hypothetical protein
MFVDPLGDCEMTTWTSDPCIDRPSLDDGLRADVGVADGYTLGATRWLRHKIDLGDAVDECSPEYRLGTEAGTGIAFITGAGAAVGTGVRVYRGVSAAGSIGAYTSAKMAAAKSGITSGWNAARSVLTRRGNAPSTGTPGVQGAGDAAKTTPELASGMERTGSALTNSDPFHRSVSWVVDNPAAQRFGIKGGDGIARDLYQLPGEVNGKSGVFEWIIDRSGTNPVINHQRFIPGGSITGYPNQVVP